MKVEQIAIMDEYRKCECEALHCSHNKAVNDDFESCKNETEILYRLDSSFKLCLCYQCADFYRKSPVS